MSIVKLSDVKQHLRTCDLEGLARLCAYPLPIDICLCLLEKRLVVELSHVSTDVFLKSLQ